ncbi:unnamed protein product, partial [Tetraodon nigroviridis]
AAGSHARHERASPAETRQQKNRQTHHLLQRAQPGDEGEFPASRGALLRPRRRRFGARAERGRQYRDLQSGGASDVPQLGHFQPGQGRPEQGPLSADGAHEESSAPAPLKIQEPVIQDITPEPPQPSDPLQPPLQPEPPYQTQLQVRRSRRLSKEGGAPSDNPFLPLSSEQSSPGPPGPQNGACDIQAAPTGVIQSTRRKRRVSQE